MRANVDNLMTVETFGKWIARHDYIIEQVDGARVLRPRLHCAPDDAKCESVHRCEVFISNIPGDVGENELVPFLCSAGSIHQLKLLTTLSGKTRGFAYVIYASVESAHLAVRSLNSSILRINQASPIKVNFSANNCSLDLTNLPVVDDIEDKLLKQLATLMVRGVVSVRLVAKKKINNNNNNNDNESLKARISFLDHKCACKARRVLVPKFVFENHQVNVDWSRPNNSHYVRVVFNRANVEEAIVRSYLEFDECRIVSLVYEKDAHAVLVRYRNIQELELVWHRISTQSLSLKLSASTYIVSLTRHAE